MSWYAKVQSALFKIALFMCAVSLPSVSAHAFQLSSHDFAKLAKQCAPSVSFAVLHAVAHTESHLDPLALHNNTRHLSISPNSIATGAKQAKEWIAHGDSVDLGLMQIDSGNLGTLGLTVESVLDPCRSLAAGADILAAAYSKGAPVAERQAALLIALSRYNTGRALAGLANGYANRVISEQSAALNGKWTLQRAPNTPPQWDIWGTSGVEPTSWVVTADGSSEIERAGAQTSHARSEGRAPASPSEKGEPYEVFAYQESEESKR